jgi:hypothetical protein
MPGLDADLGVPSNVHVNIFRNSNYSSSAEEYYIGCSSDPTDSASVLSTGITFTLPSGEGWNCIEVPELGEHIVQYSSTWYLLIGNPNKKSTYAEIAGYGSGYEVYIELMYSDGSRIMLASDGMLVPYVLCRAENGSLTQYDVYHAENGSLVGF